MLLDCIEKLKRAILSSQSYEIRENIYIKRHITIDIPSMYGSYHEIKFDCLGLVFRFETLVSVLFEGLIQDIDLSLITKATFYQIYSLLRLLDKALKLDGISSVGFERQLEFLAHSLEVKGFTQAVKNIIRDNFHKIYGQNLNRILSQIFLDRILPKFLPQQKQGISYKRAFSGKQMKKVALTYRELIRSSGIEILETPYEQLYLAIKTVLDSWESPKAKTYRKIMGISDDWGTAVTVQAMVYGNISRKSGSGVIFTHNPRWSGDTLKLWGDFTIGNQGEDVVAGLVNTNPISIFQQEIEMRETDITLETHFPEIYKALKDWAHDLIDNRGWSPQEMEFTFEGDGIEDLYLLQTRDMTIRERKKAMTFDFEEQSKAAYLGHGIGVSGGAMSGRLVFSLKDIDEWRLLEPGTHLILARADTVPDDIREIHAADGSLTASG